LVKNIPKNRLPYSKKMFNFNQN